MTTPRQMLSVDNGTATCGWRSCERNPDLLLNHGRRPVVNQKESDERDGGCVHPPVIDEDVVFLEFSQKRAPTWDGFADAKAEEGKRHFSEDELWDKIGGHRQKQCQDLRKNVFSQDVKVRRAHRAC